MSDAILPEKNANSQLVELFPGGPTLACAPRPG